jgi:hypothetical protein
MAARPGDSMAGAGGGAGPVPDVRHQRPGETPTSPREDFLFSFLWERFYFPTDPLKHDHDPSQTARACPGVTRVPTA